MVVLLELLSKKSQSMLVAQQMALPEEKCDLLEKVITQHDFLDEKFTGNPQHLIAICDRTVGDDNLQIFELLNSLVHKMIKKALVKMGNIGDNDDNLAGPVRKNRELLVIANAYLLNLDFPSFTLTEENVKLVNNIGILNVTKKKFDPKGLFSDFLVSVYLIHKFGIEGIQAVDFVESLAKIYPGKEHKFTIALKLLENYMTVAEFLPDNLLYSLDLDNIFTPAD
jgi:hypothetical protein